MAKYKAFYAKEEDIPQFARDNKLYVSRNGRWEFDHDEFEDLGDLTAPGLAANRDRIKGEKLDLQNEVTAEKKRADEAEAELRKVQKPGSKIISDDDAKQLESYQKLGPVKDLEKMKGEHTEYAGKLQNLESEKGVRKLCEDAKLNFEAVNDFVSSNRAKGAKLIVKDVKQKNDKTGKEELVKQAFIQVEEDKGNGRFESKEYDLKAYAKDNLPGYMAKALFEVEDSAEPEEKKTGLKIPSLSGGKAKSDDAEPDAKTRADQYNSQRNTRTLPWDKPEAAAQS
jgi:hypothetical protein